MKLRLATAADLPALHALIPYSVRALSRGHYTDRQIESAIRHVFGPDTRLIGDGTYYVVEADDGTLAGCGGWSRRRTLYGGDQAKTAVDDLLRPDEPARVRAFFVEPRWARRGVATLLLQVCLEAAAAAGHRSLVLAATLPGEAFYRRWGFSSDERFEQTLPDGTAIAFVRMSRHVGTLPPDSLSRFP